MHIDMKLNFMHILADLGFMEFTLYIGSEKVKHAIRYTNSKCACTRLSRTKGRYNLDKTQSQPKGHTRVWHKIKVVQIISKNQINTKIDSKVQQVNKATTHDHIG